MVERRVVRVGLVGRGVEVGAEDLVQRLPEGVHGSHPVRRLRFPAQATCQRPGVCLCQSAPLHGKT